MKIEFPLFVVKAPTSISLVGEKNICPQVFTMIRPQILDIECKKDIVDIGQFQLVSIDQILYVCCRSFCVTILRNLEVHQMNVKTVFLN